MLRNTKRALAAATVAALALTTVSFTPAEARMRRGDAAVLAAVVGVFGTIAAIAAADAARDQYRHRHGPYYGAPVYAPPAYSGPVYPAPGYGHWRRHHWHD